MKSATWIAHDPHSQEAPERHSKWIWKLDTIPKIKIFLWQLCHGALPIRGILLERGVNINPTCPLCLDNVESIDHLFRESLMVKKVWDLAEHHEWFPLYASPYETQNVYQWLNRMKNSKTPKLLQKISYILWIIWKFRNATVFQNEIFNR